MYMDVKRYYVKRCIGLPGDTLEIRNGYFQVNNTNEKLGNLEAQEAISHLQGALDENVTFYAFPHSDRFGWTIKDFGPYYIPKKGSTIPIDTMTFTLYHKLIKLFLLKLIVTVLYNLVYGSVGRKLVKV